MKCPKCERELEQDAFSPPGIYRCPAHGEVISEPPLQVAWPKNADESEFDIFLGWIVRLGHKGELDYSISRSLSKDLPSEIVVENHGDQCIDVRFKFDPFSGNLIGVSCYTDKRRRRK